MSVLFGCPLEGFFRRATGFYSVRGFPSPLIAQASAGERFGLAEGMTFVDVGAGTGFFTRAAAAIVGPDGQAIAVDSSAAMLRILESHNGSHPVRAVLSTDYEIPLESGIADLVLGPWALPRLPKTFRRRGLAWPLESPVP